jgi:hypothetical protein
VLVVQTWALMQRQFLLKWQDKFALTVSWVTSVGIAIICAAHHCGCKFGECLEAVEQQTDEQKTSSSKGTGNSIPFHLQTWALMQRQFLLKWQDKFALTVSWVTSVGMPFEEELSLHQSPGLQVERD